jgi:hypothetical protein
MLWKLIFILITKEEELPKAAFWVEADRVL